MNEIFKKTYFKNKSFGLLGFSLIEIIIGISMISMVTLGLVCTR